MSATRSSGPGWSGDMLDRPEMVEAFAKQLRGVLSDQAEFVARIRRDAEAMWKANPPEGYGSFEAWWRHWKTTTPFAKIQEHIEEAARLTFALEARYRRNRHEIPAAKAAAAEARQAAAIPQHRTNYPRQGVEQRPAEPQADESFMNLVRERRDRSAS